MSPLLFGCFLMSCCFAYAQEIIFVPHKDATGKLSAEFLVQLKKLFDPDVFIETGTFHGATTIVAANIFPVIHTIELSKQLYKKARKRLQEQKHVAVHRGSSDVLLPKILRKNRFKRPLIFLDAHYSGGITAQGRNNTPILDELMAIHKKAPQAILIIDDLRLFQGHDKLASFVQNHPEHEDICGYPTLQKFYTWLRHLDSRYELVVVGDAFLVYRHDLYPCIRPSALLRALTTSRLCPINETSAVKLASVFEAERVIMQAHHTEGKMLSYLGTCGLNKPDFFATYYDLWNALIAQGDGRIDQAKILLRRALHNGMSQQRISHYEV